MNSDVVCSAAPSNSICLPEVATTRGGVVFFPHESQWRYRDGHSHVSMNFYSIKNTSIDFITCVKMAMLWYVENKSPNHAENIFGRMKHFLDKIYLDSEIVEITNVDILNYRAHLDVKNQWYLATISGFLKRWNMLGIPGVSKDAIALLNDIRLKGNRKGEAVLTMDPLMGPFTNIERDALHNSVNSSYAQKLLSMEDYVLCLLVMLFGQRPVQYSNLKVCDVRVEQSLGGNFVYTINFPRAKQRGKLPRSEFKERILIPQIGSLLVEYARSVEARFVNKLPNMQQAPLFPDSSSVTGCLEGFLYHQTSGAIRKRLKIIFNKLKVISERTGRPMHVTPIRFRRTVGTLAAAEGHGELVIAELLDHSDTQNVGVYVAATPEIVERIDRAVAAKLAPLAQAFAGVMVDSKSEQNVPFKERVVAPQCSQDFMPVGTCGQHGFCAFAAPFACYTCANFRAWLDGPHEAVLDYLVAERDRLSQIDQRVAAVNDRTILAVAQVVELCKAQRNQ